MTYKGSAAAETMIHIAASLPGQYFNKGKELLF